MPSSSSVGITSSSGFRHLDRKLQQIEGIWDLFLPFVAGE